MNENEDLDEIFNQEHMKKINYYKRITNKN